MAILGAFLAELWESHGLFHLPTRDDLVSAFRAHLPAMRPLFWALAFLSLPLVAFGLGAFPSSPSIFFFQ